MSKKQRNKRDAKKKPTMTPKERRAAKKAKKQPRETIPGEQT